MADSSDMFGEDPAGDGPAENEQDKAAPSAAELEAAGQSALFGDAPSPKPAAEDKDTVPAKTAASETTKAQDAPAQAETAQPYRVLARKYRPQTFAELIGQEAMVQTLANAIKRDRLAHAFLMTGVRGVGKTSTARLIAKALNCIGPDGQGGPTISPCGECEPCHAIAEGRHIDVIEMDAASHTGVDDVREIIEAVRYAAVSARYKIYIIDEVHMLSRNAFNALLKTLEEPPAHVKFLFATTEVDKLPVTVLSRCQRFDLRRIPTDMLKEHFNQICAQEGVSAEDEALAMIAAAAEGSVRDGLSILDQAIAHADLEAEGVISAARVQDMLGLADKSVRDALFAALLSGDGATLLDGVARQYALGIEPLSLMRAIMDLVHRITVAQIAASGPDAPTKEERELIAQWASEIGAAQLHRLWQLLMKGHEEVRIAPDPMAAAQMALLRVMHAGTMPDPGKLAEKLEKLTASAPVTSGPQADGAGAGTTADATAISAPSPAPLWADLVTQVEKSGQLLLAQTMRDWVQVISLQPGHLIYTIAPGFHDDPGQEMRDALAAATGQRWVVERGTGQAAPTLREQAEASKEAEAEALRRDPLIAAVLSAFPQAEILETSDLHSRNDRNWSMIA